MNVNTEPSELTFIDDVIALWKPYASKYQTFQAFWESSEALELRQRYENVDIFPGLMPWGASWDEYKSITSLARLQLRCEAGVASAAEKRDAEKLFGRHDRQIQKRYNHYMDWLEKNFPKPSEARWVKVTVVVTPKPPLPIFEFTMADTYELCISELAREMALHDAPPVKDQWDILIQPAECRATKQMWLRIPEGYDQL